MASGGASDDAPGTAPPRRKRTAADFRCADAWAWRERRAELERADPSWRARSFGKTLGEGSYSTVVLATEKATNERFAMKILEKRHIVKEKKVKYVEMEKQVLSRLTHPFFVKLYYTFQARRAREGAGSRVVRAVPRWSDPCSPARIRATLLCPRVRRERRVLQHLRRLGSLRCAPSAPRLQRPLLLTCRARRACVRALPASRWHGTMLPRWPMPLVPTARCGARLSVSPLAEARCARPTPPARAGHHHRDFKPNVLLASDWHVRITDFGTARLFEGAARASRSVPERRPHRGASPCAGGRLSASRCVSVGTVTAVIRESG